MSQVKISPKFQIVIPKEIREQMSLKAGQRLELMSADGRIELVPVEPVRNSRGFLKGIKASFKREPDRL